MAFQHSTLQGRNHGENLGSTSTLQWWAESAHPGMVGVGLRYLEI